jgi:hypothetical protein
MDELLVIKAALELQEESGKVNTDLRDYVDNLLAEYNILVEEIEKDMENEAKKTLH